MMDDTKAAKNWRDYGIAFPFATQAFSDPFAAEWIDNRENYGEKPLNLLGMCQGVLLHVTYTERGDRIRLISARRAESHEHDHYYRENSI
ncbi:BrnT family toxin [Methylomagnum sp.]